MRSLKILIIATQPFPSAVRLCLRLHHYGMEVMALCPVGSKLTQARAVSSTYPFWAWNPLSSLRTAIDKGSPDFLIPIDDRAVWFLHELVERHAEYKKLVEHSIGPSDSFATTRSRASLLSLASSLGIAIPNTIKIDDAAGMEECIRTLSTPFFLKKDGTWAGIGVRVVRDSKLALAAYKRLLNYPTFLVRVKQRLLINDPTAFTKLGSVGSGEISAQAHIDGVPATAMFACREGVILGNVQARVISSKGELGAALMIELFEDPRIERAGRLLAKILGLSGFFGLDFVLKAGSWEPFLIEMNPRCTQFGHLALANRPDLAGALCATLAGDSNPEIGAPDLQSFIYFYPQAVEYDPESSFLDHARLDVRTEELQAIVEIGKANSTWSGWLRAQLRRPIAWLEGLLRPSNKAAIFYHDAYVTRTLTGALNRDQTIQRVESLR